MRAALILCDNIRNELDAGAAMELPDRAHFPSGPNPWKGVKGGDVDVGENAMRRLGNHALRTAQGIWQVGS